MNFLIDFLASHRRYYGCAKDVLLAGVNGMARTERTETQIVKLPKIKASERLWAAFERWMDNQGCQTLPEGFRTAMRIVTNFQGESQAKSLSS